MKKTLLFLVFTLIFSTFSYSQIGINQPTDYIVCDGIFDLQTKDSEILNGLNPSDYLITYHETLGDADNGTNALSSPYFSVTNPQLIYARVLEINTGNIEITSFNLISSFIPENGFASEQITCGVAGFATFDLTTSIPDITGNNTNISVLFFETSQEALDNINPIENTQVYTNVTPYFQTIYLRLEDQLTGCFYANPNVVLFLNVIDFADLETPSPYVACDTDDDGISVFNLDTKTDEILGGNQNPNLLVTYHLTQADADAFFNVLDPIFTNTTPFAQTLFVRVTSNTGDCYQVVTLDLVVDTDCVSASSVEAFVCGDDPNMPVDYDLTSQEAEIVNGQNPLTFI